MTILNPVPRNSIRRIKAGARVPGLLAAGTALITIATSLGGSSVAAASRPASKAAGTGHSAAAWSNSVAFTNRIVSSAAPGGGFPTPTGEYVPGTCEAGSYDSNKAESILVARPGTEHLVGASKFFFGPYSTYYNFTTGTFDITGNTSHSQVIGGYDCTTTGTQQTPPTWTNTTDPNIAFDTQGRLHDVVLAFNNYRLDGNIYESHSDDNGRHWTKGNSGRALQVGPIDATDGTYLDKPWVAVNTHPDSKWADHVYAIWAVRRNDSSSIALSVSRDRGDSFTTPITLPTPQPLGATNPWPYVSVGARGVVYVVYTTYAADGSARFWTSQSRNDGRTWGHFRPAGAQTRVDLDDTFPGTKVHVGAPESFATSPTQPGHLYLAWEEQSTSGRLGIRFTSSRDGGRTWSSPRAVNDDAGSTDQIQPVIAAGSRGSVAVAFYDKRLACPSKPFVAAADRGKKNTCISVSLQAMHDTGRGVVDVGANHRLSDRPWDPNQPVQHRRGLGQSDCDAYDDPCTDIFIGDYFGLVITGHRVSTLSVTTAEPTRIRSDSGRPIYYQQQVLAQVSRSDLGI